MPSEKMRYINRRMAARLAIRKDIEMTPLKEEIEKGNFREDLYHRLSVILINVPALDERKEDIPLLIKHFAKQICDEYGSAVKTFDDKAIKKLQERAWTGNIRELRNVVERLIILGGQKITVENVESFVN